MSEATDGMQRLELQSEGGTAILDYTLDAGGTLTIWHVEVPIALRGKGLGGELVEKARAIADENHLKLNPVCPFAKHYLSRD